MDKLDPAVNAFQTVAGTALTATLVVVGLFIIIVIISWVLIKNTASQNTLSKAQIELQNKQIDLQSKSLDAFNNVANQVGNLERTISLQNIKQSEYTDNIQKHLTAMTEALGTTLKNSMTAIAVLDRVEKNGNKMVDELGAARKEVQAAAEKSEAAKSGIHVLTEIVTTGLSDINNKLNVLTESVKDLPQLREQLADAITSINQLKHDVQRMDVPRTETKPPDAPPVSAEGD